MDSSVDNFLRKSIRFWEGVLTSLFHILTNQQYLGFSPQFNPDLAGHIANVEPRPAVWATEFNGDLFTLILRAKKSI